LDKHLRKGITVNRWILILLERVAPHLLGTLALMCGAGLVQAQGSRMPDFYSEPGMSANRDYTNQHFGENIDPFTGALQLSYTDIFIPGNGGFDLKISRAYNSSLVDRTTPKHQSVMGVGWTFHMGRVTTSKPYADGEFCPAYNASSSADNPVLELPDGSKQQLFFVSSDPAGNMRSTQGWRAQCDKSGVSPGIRYLVWSPDGTRYTMERRIKFNDNSAYYTTAIRDRNGNFATVFYRTSNIDAAVLTGINTNDGRSVSFGYSDNDQSYARVTSMTGPSGQWFFNYTVISGVANTYQLTSVTRPVTGNWIYAYNDSQTTGGSYQMKSHTQPGGGIVSYSWEDTSTSGPQNGKTSRLKGKTAGGANWSWSYDTSGAGSVCIPLCISGDRTDTTTPSGAITYWHHSPNSVASGDAWKIGLLIRKRVNTLQTEDYLWSKVLVSDQSNGRSGEFAFIADSAAYMPVLLKKTVTRGSATYVTEYSNHDSYGNPGTISESGPNSGTRSATITYFRDISRWIVNGFPDDETRSGGPDISRTYDTDGNLTNISRDGVSTSYTYNADGTVATMTDARTSLTTYSNYKRGIAQTEARPEGVSITRVVDDAGNVTSQTIGGQTFGYTYDQINRLKSVNYPIGDDVAIAYTPTTKTATRGTLTETTTHNGYGQLIGVKRGTIEVDYTVDALGRRVSQTNPNDAANKTLFEYDTLDRVTQLTQPGGSTRSTSYSGNSQTITDERGNATTYSYRSYGDPGVRFLMGIATPQSLQSTAIERNDRDLITKVDQGSKSRSFGYNAQFYLSSITDPETGVTTFGRDGNGNMTTRKVGSSGVTNYTYDRLNRLTQIEYPNARTINKTYNARGKVLTVTGGQGNRAYTYDGNDNLATDELTIDGQTLTATYGYNTRDQLSSLTYPRTGRTVSFSPNTLGWPTQAGSYATGATYFASGALDTFIYGNGIAANYGQDNRLRTSSVAMAGVMNSAYSYDAAGNLSSVSDVVDARLNRSSIGYDPINRLTSVSGPWTGSTINYDAAGNITARNDGTTSEFSYTNGNNRLVSATGLYSTLTQSGTRSATYTYDDYGNVIGDGTNTFDYDDAPNLICSNCSDPGFKTEYFYDGNNSRAAVKRNGITTYEFHDAAGRLLLEYTPSDDNQTTEHIYLGDKRIAQRSFNGRTVSANACLLDVSGDGISNQTDALIIQRYAFGIRGDQLIQGISNHSPAFVTLASAPTSTQPTSVNQIQIRLNTRFTNSDAQNGNDPSFDIDRDGSTRATTDALLILRYLRGGVGVTLTSDATNPSGSRGISSSDTGTTLQNKIAAIQGYLQSLCSDQPNGETITYFHNDLVGSPVAATNASGQVIWRESYRAYGDRLTNQMNNGTVTDRNSLHFSNKKTEALKGGATIAYFQNRYYDPSLGRFLSVDPVHFKESNIHSFNRYAYANNNPYRFVDPDGNEAEEIEEKNLQYEGLLSKANAENAAQYWADKQVATGNVLYAIPGVIATAWASNGPEILGILAATRGRGGPRADALKPGPFAGESIPARSPARDFTQAERSAINDIGRKTGCHTCGTTDPGTKSGNFVPDHQPISSLMRTGQSQRLYPHCLNCSNSQGGQANKKLLENNP
jgi:RHS repeat-associated protein